MRHPVRQPSASTLVAPGATRERAVDARWNQLEKEADRAADEALRLPKHERPPALGHMKPGAVASTHAKELPKSVSRVLDTPGAPLDRELRLDMETRFSHDFSGVRVHAGEFAAQSARDVEAQAYTVGDHIVFGTGRFAPATYAGRHLIAHELAHVIQQSPSHSSGATASVLQRKPVPGSGEGAESFDPTTGVDPPTLIPESGPPAPDARAGMVPPETNPLQPVQTFSPAHPNKPAPATNAPSPLPVAVAQNDEAAELMPPPPAIEQTGPAEMPRLVDLLSSSRPPARTNDRGAQLDLSEDVDLGDLLGALEFGVTEARSRINAHADSAVGAIGNCKTKLENKLGDQLTAANKSVEKLAKQRRDQVDMTFGAHIQQLGWQVKNWKAAASTEADAAKSGQRDGFRYYREQIADVFDGWSKMLEDLRKEKSAKIIKMTQDGAQYALDYAEGYYIQYVRSYLSQPQERKDVQREAANEVALDFVTQSRALEKQAPADIAQVTSEMTTSLNTTRDEALKHFDEGLPHVLKGIDDQLAAAHFDMDTKGRELRQKLEDARAVMDDRVDFLEAQTKTRNANFRTKVNGDIKSSRDDAERQLRRAEPQAIKPIIKIVSDTVGVLTSSDEDLDPNASHQFVGEVVEYSFAAADASGAVFEDARDAGMRHLGAALPYARRGFAAGGADLGTTFRNEGATNEWGLIQFETDSDNYLNATLADLKETFKGGIVDAGAQLKEMLTDSKEKMNEPMAEAYLNIEKNAQQVINEYIKAKRRIDYYVTNAARKAAWKYDHPIRDRIVRGTEIFLGVLGAIALVAALIFMLPAIVGSTAAAVILVIAGAIGAFAAGYFGAAAYDKRKKAGASGVSALFGAVADVTGITDVKRAFTDEKMSDFERGFALGNFLFGLFGAAQGAIRFAKVAKLRLPKVFTNPFKPKGVSFQPVGPTKAPGTTAVDAPMVDVPGSKRVGYELPHQQGVPEVSGTGVVSPRLHHRQSTVPETTAPGPKGDLGFQSPNKPPTPDVGAVRGPPEPRLHHRKTPEPETPTQGPKGELGFQSQNKPPQPDVEVARGAPEPKLHHRKRDIPEMTAPAEKRPIGLGRDKAGAKADLPTTRRDPPAPVAESTPPGGVISQMPPARHVPDSHRPAGGAGQHTGNQPVGSLKPEAPLSAPDAPVSQQPTKGSVVSTVEPEVPKTGGPRETNKVVDAELADELALRAAQERRVAAHERYSKAQDAFDDIKDFKKKIGDRSKRDYVDDEFDRLKLEYENAKGNLADAKRAEIKAEAAERIHLKRRRSDLDPAAAKHDPELRKHATEEFNRRQDRLAHQEEYIRGHEKEIEAARARVAEKQKAFDNAPPGSHWNPDTKTVVHSQKHAKKQLNRAERDLSRAEGRLADARKAMDKQIERMQDLDRVLNPDKYPQLSADKGVFGENMANQAMDKDGWQFRNSSKQPVEGTKPREQGLDGVYEKANPGPKEPRHVVGESKYDSSRPTSRQKQKEWVDDHLDATVGREHANRMRSEGYEYWVNTWNPKLKRVVRTKMWEFKPYKPRKTGLGGRILGEAHPFPPE